MNSVIEAQEEKNWCIKEEFRKCKDSQAYFYENYVLINGEKPTVKDVDYRFFKLIDNTSKKKKGILSLSSIMSRR